MKNIELKNFTNEGFKITWKLIYLGFKGSDTFYDFFDVEDILDYAKSLLQEKNYNDNILDLASEYKENTEKINVLLLLLSENENSDKKLELRKLRFIKIFNNIKSKNFDNIRGIIDLIDIFSETEIQEDSIFESENYPIFFLEYKNGNINPNEFYKNYDSLFEDFKIWIAKEKNYILNKQ